MRLTFAKRLLCLLVVLAVPCLGAGDEAAERRAQTGMRLFKSLLAADLDLAKKTTNEKLLIVFYYVDDKERAAEMASRFAADKVRGFDVITEITNDPAFAAFNGRNPAGVFVTQPPAKAALQSVIKYGIARSVIVYSPFEGHVEAGVLGGLSVEAQVRPFVNAATLEASHITLKEFFLKVTKVHR